MKAQPVLRVRRRAATSYSAPQPTRRKWVIPVTLGILLAVVVAIVGTFGTLAYRGNYLMAPNSDAGYSASREMPPDGLGLLDTNTTTYAAYVPGTDVAAQGWDRMIIRTATVDLTVKDVTTAIERVKAI